MLIYSYINTRENWKNSKLCENTPPCGRRVSTQFLVFPISTRVDITVYQHGKCFIFLKYDLRISYTSLQMPDPKTEKLVLQKSFSFSAAKLWNSLPTDLRNADTTSDFKNGICALRL